jgi:HD domain
VSISCELEWLVDPRLGGDGRWPWGVSHEALRMRLIPSIELSVAKMLAGAIAFEISDIQEDESEAALARRSNVTMVHWVENGWMEFSRSTADIVLAHHEFFDGTCYPRGLRGEQIPLGARIISIADGSRCHAERLALSQCPSDSHAREEIRSCAGTQFDPKIVEVFLSIPESHWIDLRESLGSPFRLTHARNMGFVQ